MYGTTDSLTYESGVIVSGKFFQDKESARRTLKIVLCSII